MFSYSHHVHLSDTDVTGQVYYVKPLEWLEWCRVEWFQASFGNFMDFVKANQQTFFPSKVETHYKKPMFFGDHLTIQMSVKEIKKVSFIFAYKILREQEIVLTSAITMVCFNPVSKRLTPLSDTILDRLHELAT